VSCNFLSLPFHSRSRARSWVSHELYRVGLLFCKLQIAAGVQFQALSTSVNPISLYGFGSSEHAVRRIQESFVDFLAEFRAWAWTSLAGADCFSNFSQLPV